MDLKIFLFKIILIFNIVVVYSIGCRQIAIPGTHKLGNYTIVVGEVYPPVAYKGGLLYRLWRTFLDYNNGSAKVEVRACVTTFTRVSYLEFYNSSSYRDNGNGGLYLDETNPSFHSSLYLTNLIYNRWVKRL